MTPDLEGIIEMAQRVEHNPLHDAYAVILTQGLDGTGGVAAWPDVVAPVSLSARA